MKSSSQTLLEKKVEPKVLVLWNQPVLIWNLYIFSSSLQTFGVSVNSRTLAIELEYFSTIFCTSGSCSFSVEETITTSFWQKNAC